MLPGMFSGIAMQSPANGDLVEAVRELYEERDQDKGYDLTYTWVRKGQHNWENWGPLLDEVLLTFFAKPD